jgi:radical SAM protein with 4Fe4S-binding SPASM domain
MITSSQSERKKYPASGIKKLRFNKEYFGYIVGYPEGDVFLVRPEAAPLLHDGACQAEIAPYLLDTFEVRPGFHLNAPPLMWLEITRQCNLRCKHCYVSAGFPRSDELPNAAIHEIIDDLADMGVWAVAITGGEPTLHPAFADIVIHAHERDLLVGVATNGMFLTEKLLERIPREGVIISVSIDDLHSDRPTEDNEFLRAASGLELSQSMGFLTNIMTNTHHRNINKLGSLMDWAEQRGISIRSVPFTPLGRGKSHPELENTVEDVQLAADFWMRECVFEHEYHQKAGLCVGVLFNYGLSLAYMTRRCSSGRYLAYICGDGTVYPCTMCAGEELLSPGNVRETGIGELWQQPWKIREFCWDNFTETCERCPINMDSIYCTSRCPAMSHARNNTLFGCGASPFEKISAVVRTSLLQKTPTGRSSGIPQLRTTSQTI